MSLTLSILIDHPFDWPSREKGFFSFCAASPRMKTLLLKSPLNDLLETTRYFLIKNLEVCLQRVAGEIEYDVFRSATDFAQSISLVHIIASIGRLAHEDTSLLKFIHQVLKFLISGQASNSRVSASFSGKLYLSLHYLLPLGSQD